MLAIRLAVTAEPSGFSADCVGCDRAAQDLPEVLERQGSRPSQHHREGQIGGFDAGDEQCAQDDGAAEESGDM